MPACLGRQRPAWTDEKHGTLDCLHNALLIERKVYFESKYIILPDNTNSKLYLHRLILERDCVASNTFSLAASPVHLSFSSSARLTFSPPTVAAFSGCHLEYQTQQYLYISHRFLLRLVRAKATEPTIVSLFTANERLSSGVLNHRCRWLLDFSGRLRRRLIRGAAVW